MLSETKGSQHLQLRHNRGGTGHAPQKQCNLNIQIYTRIRECALFPALEALPEDSGQAIRNSPTARVAKDGSHGSKCEVDGSSSAKGKGRDQAEPTPMTSDVAELAAPELDRDASGTHEHDRCGQRKDENTDRRNGGTSQGENEIK
eukprot:45972-Pleurochrysis_carterae.AAC.2